MNLNENINRIKQVMGLLNEQASGGLVADDVYAAIGNIEKVFSKVDENDNIIGIPYDPRGKEENIKQAIKSTIGFDNWNKMDSKLKGQVYSFMFQSDSGTSTRLRWLAGLAQAIDPNINRLTIVDKPLNNPQVINAIKLVNDNINKIDYATYIKVVKNQYNNISETPNDLLNRLYIWEPRPEALDKLMNGESWDDVKKWWWNRIDPNGKIKNNPYKNVSNNNQQSVVTPIKTDSAKQITPIVQSADIAKTNNTSPVNQTNNLASTQQNNVPALGQDITQELSKLNTLGIVDTGVNPPYNEIPNTSNTPTTYRNRKPGNLTNNPSLRRPWGDPYIYYSATTGDYYFYNCGKNRNASGKPITPCKKINPSEWRKATNANAISNIKSNIFK